MTWTYSNYAAQTSNAARLAMARQFLGELMGSVSADVAKDGASRNSQSLNSLIAMVQKDIAGYEGKVGNARAGGMSLGRLGNRN
jgi:hypothetical protein